MRNTKPGSELGPADLRESIGAPRLVDLALNAVQTLDWQSPALKDQETDECRPQMMMTLLTYCYAAGLFGSWDVEWAIRNDSSARYICAHSYPDTRTIRAFRRRNRTALLKTLSSLLHQAWAWRLDQAEEFQPNHAWIDGVPSSQIASSAQHRLDAAAVMDEILFEN